MTNFTRKIVIANHTRRVRVTNKLIRQMTRKMLHRILNILLAASDVQANSLRGGLILVLARTDTDWFNTVYRPSKITVKHIRVGNSVVEP